MQATETKTTERMMTNVESSSGGLNISFADGLVSLVPWDDIKEVQAQSDVLSVEIGTPYEVIIRTRDGHVAEIPWDFARHFGDPRGRERNTELAARGQRMFAGRLRSLRCRFNLSRQELADRGGLDKATIGRIEVAVQQPTFEVIRKLAGALGCQVQELMMDDRSEYGGNKAH